VQDFLDYMQRPMLQIGDTQLTLGQVLAAPFFVLLGILLIVWCTRLLRGYMQRRQVSPDLIQVVSRAFIILASIILIISALDLLQVPLAAFAFVSGAVAIGVGFGAQNIINNFISGWILMWERPIRIGDFLEVGNTQGTVEAINTRSTRIRRVDGVHMLIPNSHLLENMVVNWTLIDRLTRTSVRVGVSYGSPVQRVSELIAQAANEHPDVLTDPPHMVLFEDFGDNALVFELNVWVNATAEKSLRKIRSDLRYRIESLFNEEGIVIAFPQRDVHLDGEIVVRQHP
jgi:small-conductance mechanosensitive channel